MLQGTSPDSFLKIAPERKVTHRVHARVGGPDVRSGAILRILGSVRMSQHPTKVGWVMTSATQATPTRLTAERLLDGLNPPQREAVLHEGGPVLVVAGAGSGKTRVLTRRICYLVTQRRAHPGSILAITFTNKAAAEMRGRVMDLVGNRAKLMWISTFHSACVRILRAEIGRFNMSRTFSIYDDADSKRLMQLVAHDLDLDPKRFPVRAIMNWVSHCKNELVDHESAASRAGSPLEESYAEAYREYQRRLIAANALDFDDLIMTTVHLLQAFPDLREQYRRRFRHVLVDEYQDTDHAQYVLIRELCAADAQRDPDVVAIDPPELMVVGDSDQSIYAFRGATIRNINDFESDFPGAKVILLEQNYRSTQTILNAANAVITRNENRKPKNLWSDAGDGELLVGYVADTEHDEAQFVATEIRRLNETECSPIRRRGGVLSDQCSIPSLRRNLHPSRHALQSGWRSSVLRAARST